MRRKSIKTSVAGLVAGVSTLVITMGPLLGWQWASESNIQAVAGGVTAIALAVLGLVGRDDDVTSEGRKAAR